MKKTVLGILAFTSFSVFADSGNYIRITTLQNLSNRNCATLERPKTFKVDVEFVKKGYCLEFYAFLDREEGQNMCFVGKPAAALEVIDEILAVSTGDAFVYPSSEAKVTRRRVSRDFTYEGEGGESSETATVSACD